MESGDFVIVDSENTSPRDGDYVVSVIDGMANIKNIVWIRIILELHFYQNQHRNIHQSLFMKMMILE